MLKDRLRYEDGSSPLTRGKRVGDVGDGVHCRLIPAHAGKTCPACSPPRGRRGSSPLTRGKHGQLVGAERGRRGSSPLTRGKLRSARADAIGPGLIPAHAGKTGYALSGSSALGAHPRSRGENSVAL